ncbi:STAS domain-containing protein [Streptomyces sp. NPDC017943]|uniref:STAS domain-containing protein n=1 Tax=Streptomyces sp. NPDC017943 TaxID=3365019 RepID=UPI00379E287B
MPPTQRPDRPPHLSAEHHEIDGVRVVTLRGEIDRDVQDVLREALLGGTGEASERIVADLAGVTFMDSSGINVLLAAHLQTKAAQGWVRIAGARRPVLRVLQMTGVDTLITCHPTIEQALTT